MPGKLGKIWRQSMGAKWVALNRPRITWGVGACSSLTIPPRSSLHVCARAVSCHQTPFLTCSNITCSIRIHYISLLKEAFSYPPKQRYTPCPFNLQDISVPFSWLSFITCLIAICLSLYIWWVRTEASKFVSTQPLPTDSHTVAAQQTFLSFAT